MLHTYTTRPVTTLIVIATCLSLPSQAPAGNEFGQWLQQEKQAYQDYRDKRDREFTNFLQSQWLEMQVFQGLVRDKTPKPVSMPIAQLKPQPKAKPAATPIPKPVVVTPIPSRPKPTPSTPTSQLPKGQKLPLVFFGNQLLFSYDPALQQSLGTKINEKTISDFWSRLSKSDYATLLTQIDSQRRPLGLNDWAYTLLINTIAEAIYPTRNREQTMFTWFLLTKSGYRTRIAFNRHEIFLLIPAKQRFFSVPYITYKNVDYYAISFDGSRQQMGRVVTYDGNYPGADKNFDMRLTVSMQTASKIEYRKLSFKFKGSKHFVNVGYDRNTIDFFRTYPQLDIGIYFNSLVNSATGTPLLTQLGPLVEGKSEQEAVNMLLRFVQTAFHYKTDKGQFGRENYLFPEETMYYPYSDCEDRSVLFAWLIKNLLGLDVIGLSFPGHVATAVRFNDDVAGANIIYQNKRYVVADPTYINANAGMVMPVFKNVKPEIIRIL